jgi:hypothetical protein
MNTGGLTGKMLLMVKFPMFRIRCIECLILSLVAGFVAMFLLYFAGIPGKVVAYAASLPTLIIGYFLLIQPAQDEIHRTRVEPLFRLRCKLLGHKYIMAKLLPYLVWCERCGMMKEAWG